MMYKPPTFVMIHDSQNTEVMLRVEGKYPTLFEIWEKELKLINVNEDANHTIPRKKCNLYLVFYHRAAGHVLCRVLMIPQLGVGYVSQSHHVFGYFVSIYLESSASAAAHPWRQEITS